MGRFRDFLRARREVRALADQRLFDALGVTHPPSNQLFAPRSPVLASPRVLAREPLPRRVYLDDLEEDGILVMVASLRGLLGAHSIVLPDSDLRDRACAMLEYLGIVVPGGALEAALAEQDR
jgi:hypothetical protein